MHGCIAAPEGIVWTRTRQAWSGSSHVQGRLLTSINISVKIYRHLELLVFDEHFSRSSIYSAYEDKLLYNIYCA